MKKRVTLSMINKADGKITTLQGSVEFFDFGLEFEADRVSSNALDDVIIWPEDFKDILLIPEVVQVTK